MKTDRRGFFRQAAGGTAAWAVAQTWLPAAPPPSMQTTLANRGYNTGHYGLELDGVMAGWLESVEGGHATAEVVGERSGSDEIQRKHIGGVKYEDITLTCGTGMSRNFYEWLKTAIERRPLRKNVAVVVTDFNYKEQERREFYNSLITEVAFPALDAASSDVAKITVKFMPETIRWMKGSGGATGSAGNPKMQKMWLPSNFRLSIDGLDCSRVSRVEPIAVRMGPARNPFGGMRTGAGEPSRSPISNFVVTLPEANVKGFYDWHQAMVVKGMRNLTKNGALDYLGPDLREAYFVLRFMGLGILSLTVGAGRAEMIRTVRAEMICESLDFSFSGAFA